MDPKIKSFLSASASLSQLQVHQVIWVVTHGDAMSQPVGIYWNPLPVEDMSTKTYQALEAIGFSCLDWN